ncbi:DAHL domain-containing protein [Solimonas soli]|uniref:DAHL domain-containing protein n=1 Tax=Solimonas soli TaxID=413479 RepID=UPI0004BC8462|nr:DAHL domain-containing protein [Solimonas soli]
MKLRWTLPALAAVLALAGLAFLLRMTQNVDTTLHNERLALLRSADNLDIALNRAFTQTRASSLTDAAADRSKITAELGATLDALDKGPKSLRGLSRALDQRLDIFLDTIDSKFELGFDFEARSTLLTQRAINAVDAVPGRIADTLALLPAGAADDLRTQLTQLQTQIINYGVTPTPTNEPEIRATLNALDTLGAAQPDAVRQRMAELRALIEPLLADKGELVRMYRDFLSRPTAPQLEAVEQAYLGWYEGQLAESNRYRLLLAGYAGVLLLVLAWLGLRLRRSYRELDRANAELSHANDHLEDEVEKRTHELSAALDELRASQAQLIQSEKMASLGQMVAGVAHEINTPLGYARSNAEIVRTALADIRQLCGAQQKALQLLTDEAAREEDVAHALSTAQALGESIDAGALTDDLDGLLADTDHGLSQIGELVASLKDFSRVDRSRSDLFNVNDGLESALKICNNQLKGRVEVIRRYGALPAIECSPSQLNQVFLNLITNASQAIGETGRIYLHTQAEGDGVAVRILDTGSGMSEAVRARIFEPFFTTKPVGKGTGLGLSIVYRIIEDHGGRIQVRSAPGKGSEFAIHLPLRQRRAATDGATQAADAMEAVAA